MLSALDTSAGIVLAQVTVSAKSNEIRAFAPLLDAIETVLSTLTGLLFIADALHAQTAHADEIAVRGAHLMIPTEGNQPTLVKSLKSPTLARRPPRRPPPRHRARPPRDPHRQNHHPAQPRRIRFPHAQQAIRIMRTRTTGAKTSRETTYFTVSLPAEQAQPADLQDWARREWHIENRVHHVRDVTFREDLHQARTGTGPGVLASLRNTSIGYHRTNGEADIPAPSASSAALPVASAPAPDRERCHRAAATRKGPSRRPFRSDGPTKDCYNRRCLRRVKRCRVAAGLTSSVGNVEARFLTPQILPSATLPPKTTSGLAPTALEGMRSTASVVRPPGHGFHTRCGTPGADETTNGSPIVSTSFGVPETCQEASR
ncbi:ISAs1 family transposase [Micromonospora sp. NPDC048986]|uniref:ISAs1 family transposase n=1 Tax=Micromonospora sp. NPDC048986 TaxID=3155644 RepID=UPI0033E26462